MGKKLTDEFLKWTLDIDGKPAMAALNSMEQQTKLLRNANQALYNEMVKLESQGKKNSDEYKALDKQYKENNTTISLSRERMAELRKEIGLNGLTATQLGQRMKELKRAVDSSTPNSDAWKKHKKELEEVSARYNTVKSGATTTQVIFGKLGVAVGGMSGPIAGAINGIVGMGKAMWALVANPVGATIAAIVGALTLLYKAFTKTDTGAVAMEGALKAVGNVMDILLDRSMNMFKTLWSLVTFDWAGMMKNGKAAFGGIGKAIGDATTAGTNYATMMDDIDDREVAAANRMTKLRVEIETLKNKAAAATGKVKLDMLQQAMDKEIELNGIEKGFLTERNDVETMNLASKIQNSKLTMEQKEAQLKQWLSVDDQELASLTEKDSAFAEFMDKNEGEFQKLQKSKADELDKEAELQTGTRRLQKGLATERKAENDKAIQDAKEAREIALKALKDAYEERLIIIKNSFLNSGDTEDMYRSKMAIAELAYYEAQKQLLITQKQDTTDVELQIADARIKIKNDANAVILELDKKFNDDYSKSQKEQEDLIDNNIAKLISQGEEYTAFLDKWKKEEEDTNKTRAKSYLDLAEAVGQSFADTLMSQEMDFGQFLRNTLVMALDALEKVLVMSMAEAAIKDIATKGFLGIATAAAKIALMTAAFGVAKAAILGDNKKGKQSGGYADPSSSDSDQAGVYHANEFIASAPAVRNPTVKPVLDIIDIAQRTGTIKNLNLAGVLSGGRQAGGYAASSQSPAGGSSAISIGSDPEMKALLIKLDRRLEKPLKANINPYGTNGLLDGLDKINKFKTKVNKK